MRSVVVGTIATLVLGAGASGIAKSSESSLTEAAQVIQDMRTSIPDSIINRAQCVAAFPKLTKAAFIVGGEHGKGVMSCRTEATWSAPVFLEITKGSFGFQAGVSEVSLVLLVMNEAGAQKLLSNKVNLGADASIAAGPVGRQGAVATDASMTAEILSYSHAKGIFAGIDLSGGSLQPDREANRKLYGDADPKMILTTPPPAEAQAFIAALPASTAKAAPAVATAPAATAAPTTRKASTKARKAAKPIGTKGMRTKAASRPAPRMPRTASPLPFYELMSGLALAAALGMRYLRRRIA
jgi:lipid-binding SYLF domain-containing protein